MATHDFNCKMKDNWSWSDLCRSCTPKRIIVVVLCTYKPQKEPHLTNCFTIPFINTITRRTSWVLALLSLSIWTLSLLLSVRILHNVHNLCNVHVEYFAVYYCRLYMDSLTLEWRIISTFQFLNFLFRFRFALSKHFW